MKGLLALLLAILAQLAEDWTGGGLLTSAHAQLLRPPCGSYRYDYRPISVSACKPAPGISSTACTRLNRRCTCQWAASLKWVGNACPGQVGLGVSL